MHETWGTLCDTGYWSESDASAICLALGFKTGDVYYDSLPPMESSTIWHNLIDCLYTGSDVPIATCTRGTWYSTSFPQSSGVENITMWNMDYSDGFCGWYTEPAVICYGAGKH